jgi:hypothetical protein
MFDVRAGTGRTRPEVRQAGGPEEDSEEALEQQKYLWKGTDASMTLGCGRYQGERTVFAMDLIFR